MKYVDCDVQQHTTINLSGVLSLLLWYFADMRFHGPRSTVWYLSGRIPGYTSILFQERSDNLFWGTRRFSCICCFLCFDILHMHNLNRVLCIFEISPRSVIKKNNHLSVAHTLVEYIFLFLVFNLICYLRSCFVRLVDHRGSNVRARRGADHSPKR